MYVLSPKGFGPEDVILEQDFYLGENVRVTATCYERSLMDDVQITFWINNCKEIDTIDVTVDPSDVCKNATYETIVSAMAQYIYSHEQSIIEMASVLNQAEKGEADCADDRSRNS